MVAASNSRTCEPATAVPIAFCRMERGSCTWPTFSRGTSGLLDLATKKTHRLAHLGDYGAVSVFDITPDGKGIVFDRLRDNSDIVLIDLPK